MLLLEDGYTLLLWKGEFDALFDCSIIHFIFDDFVSMKTVDKSLIPSLGESIIHPLLITLLLFFHPTYEKHLPMEIPGQTL